MIQLLRVDCRLIHGQVAVYWITGTNSSSIVVANDKYATNPMLKMALTAGKPAGVTMQVLKVADAINYLNDPAHDRDKIFVVCASTADALTVTSSVEAVKSIDVGAQTPAEGRVNVLPSVHLGPTDLADLEEMEKLGREVYVQEVPSAKKLSVAEVKNLIK